MKLFYAMGGGLGHLYRVRTFINQFHLTGIKILTNNPQAQYFFLAEEIVKIQGETQANLAHQIQHQIGIMDFDEFYVDAFPAGLFGELKVKEGVKTIYLARRLKWRNYEPLVMHTNLLFTETICFEELEAAHFQFVSVSEKISFSELQYPNPDPDRIPKKLIPQGKLIWLIVHSFIHEEVESLLNYSKEIARLEKQDPFFVVITDQNIEADNVQCLSYFPAQDWFPLAERIFTGGGFNSLQQLRNYSTKVTAIPFPRKFDDQMWRVEQFKSIGALN